MKSAICRVLFASFVSAAVAACASAPPPPPPPPPEPVYDQNNPPPGFVSMLDYEQKTAELMNKTELLEGLKNNVDEQGRRLTAICADYPEHMVCDIHAAADYARKVFCEDQNFTEHVDEVVKACHQGQCKQVDEAQLLSRTDYMTLVQRLPHKLVLFKSAESSLDSKDRKSLQQFVETIGAAKDGYVIIVGRASKEGPWRDNLRYALDRAETTRSFLVNELGIDQKRVGYITYGHDKMYLTKLDSERLAGKKLSQRQANRSALIFTYPCYTAAQ